MNWIEQLLEDDLENWMYLYIEGMGLYNQEKYDEAYEALQRSWELKPGLRLPDWTMNFILVLLILNSNQG